jgi:hypothetical protein
MKQIPTRSEVGSILRRLNKRKRKKYAVGEFSYNAATLCMVLDATMDTVRSRALRGAILQRFSALGASLGGVFHGGGAELVFHIKNRNIAPEMISAIETGLLTLPGVISVTATVHENAWMDEHGVRHRASARSIVPRLRALILRRATQADGLEGMTLVIPRR